MVDVVVNHLAALGPPDSVDYSTLDPFNQQSYFHPYCSIDFNNIANIVSLPQKADLPSASIVTLAGVVAVPQPAKDIPKLSC